MHISWTEYKDGRGYWRVMADLNPSIPHPADTETFSASLREASGALYEEGAAQGDRYFHIPALDRHRGVSHFYLESYTSGDYDADEAMARQVGESTITTYGRLVEQALAHHGEPTAAERATQLAYHTVYLFQVCTLDRGTTSGLLVHDQNDVGILGSLPARVDRDLLATWADRVPTVQRGLVEALVEALPSSGDVTVQAKGQLAAAIRTHYRAHPEALALQARGDVIPPTVDNHQR
jgi:coproporphyrinogen III oxidase